MGAETEKNGVSGDNAYKRSAENTVKEDNKNLSVKKRRKFKWYHYVAAALLLIVIIIFVTWHFLPSKTLNVAVLDKTVLSYSQDDRIVKDTVYRKHQGFFWILNQQKYIKSSGEDYDFKKDYYGPMLDSEGNYDHSVELKSIADMPDLVYLADAYGLGNDTYGYYNGGTPEFSGVSADDMSVVTFAYENGAPVIAETTLFSAPLSESVYAQLTSMLGITPKKWLAGILWICRTSPIYPTGLRRCMSSRRALNGDSQIPEYCLFPLTEKSRCSSRIRISTQRICCAST